MTARGQDTLMEEKDAEGGVLLRGINGRRIALPAVVAIFVLVQIAAFTADPEERHANQAVAALPAPARLDVPNATAFSASARRDISDWAIPSAPARHAVPEAAAIPAPTRHALSLEAAIPAPTRHALSLEAAFPAPARAPYARPSASGPLIAAHRGASRYAPENTMAAFRLAETMGADCIELDVRATRDGRLVALHDETVNRTTNGKGLADELTFGEIRKLDAGGWFSPAFSGERVPSVEEVLDEFGGRVCLILELKQSAAYPGIERELALLLIERRLDRSSERGPVVIQSFDTAALRRMRKLLPDAAIAVLVRPRQRLASRDLAEYRRFADAVHLPASSARKAVIRRIRAHGLAVMVWGARGKRQVHRLLRYGVDGILTGDPRSVRPDHIK